VASADLGGRFHVSVADVRALAPSVLRHRITTSFYADAEQITPDGVISRLIEAVPAPKSGL
jgi:MoxR-like ATPase